MSYEDARRPRSLATIFAPSAAFELEQRVVNALDVFVSVIPVTPFRCDMERGEIAAALAEYRYSGVARVAIPVAAV